MAYLPATTVNGTTNATANSASLVVALGQSLVLDIGNTWTGTVNLVQTYRDGTEWLVESFTTNPVPRVVTPVEHGVSYKLVITVASGNVSYRLGRVAGQGVPNPR